MNNALLLSLLLISAHIASAAWPDVEYAEVRAYYYQPKSAGADPILTDGKLHPTVVNKEGALLSPGQVKRLTDAITGKSAFVISKCYSPHHGFIFYDRAQKPVAVVEVCLDCMGARITPRSEGLTDFLAIADLLEELTLPLGPSATDAKTYRAKRESRRIR